MRHPLIIALCLSTILLTAIGCSDSVGTEGGATVEFGDGGNVKATAIRGLVVDGDTYDVEIRFAYPSQIYGPYDGTYTFNTNSEAVAAAQAINAALNDAGAELVGEEGQSVEEGRYRIGYVSFMAGQSENTRFKTGIFEPASWREGPEETSLYNAEPITWAVFDKK